VTWTPLSRSKGQGHRAASVSVGTYLAWEITATLHLLGGARGAMAPTWSRREGQGHIMLPSAQLVKVSRHNWLTQVRYWHQGAVKKLGKPEQK